MDGYLNSSTGNFNVDKLFNTKPIYSEHFCISNCTTSKLIIIKKIIETQLAVDAVWTFLLNRKICHSFIINNSGRNQSRIIFSGSKFSHIDVNTYGNDSLECKSMHDHICDTVRSAISKTTIAKASPNCYLEFVQLMYGSVSGNYDFGDICVSGGNEEKVYTQPEILLIKVRYNNFIIPGMPNGFPEINDLNINRMMALNILQLLLRFPFEDKIYDGKFYGELDETSAEFGVFSNYKLGNTYSVNRNTIIDNGSTGFPKDSAEIIDKFIKLDNEKQQVFLNSCQSYINGLKSKTTKAIAYFCAAIENIANNNSTRNIGFDKMNDFHDKIIDRESKRAKIYKVINNTFGREIVTQDYVKYLYDIRCLHFHDGFENTNFFQNALGFDEANINICDDAERLANSFLIKWLSMA